MADKFALISSTSGYKTFKDVAAAGARTKGTPEIFNGRLVFAFDDYAAGADHLLVYEAEVVEITSTGDNVEAEIASANFTLLGGLVYWDTANANLTISAGTAAFPNVPCGRVLEKKNMTADRVAGDSIRIELGGVVSSFRVVRGESALDGANPTPVVPGLLTIASFTATLKGTAAPGLGTSVLTANISGTTANVYAWKPTGAGDATLIASTGTETFYWVAVGT